MSEQHNDGVVCSSGSPRSEWAPRSPWAPRWAPRSPWAPRWAPRALGTVKRLGVVSLIALALGAVACGPKAGSTGDKPTTTQGAPPAGGGGAGGAGGGDTSTPPTGTPTSPGTAPG